MGRIVYLCNADDKPVGGIKVIYRHAELLTSLGADACVLHPDNLDFSCTWFDHHARLLRSRDLHPESDFIIIPEIWAGSIGPQCIDQRLRFASSCRMAIPPTHCLSSRCPTCSIGSITPPI